MNTRTSQENNTNLRNLRTFKYKVNNINARQVHAFKIHLNYINFDACAYIHN